MNVYDTFRKLMDEGTLCIKDGFICSTVKRGIRCDPERYDGLKNGKTMVHIKCGVSWRSCHASRLLWFFYKGKRPKTNEIVLPKKCPVSEEDLVKKPKKTVGNTSPKEPEQLGTEERVLFYMKQHEEIARKHGFPGKKIDDIIMDENFNHWGQ